MPHTFPKAERLSGKKAIDRLLRCARYGYVEGIKYAYAPDSGQTQNRLLVSVPKRLFKRAVRRNLLKRRIREAYRLQKELLPPGGVDLLLTYDSREMLPFARIREAVAAILTEVASRKSHPGV